MNTNCVPSARKGIWNSYRYDRITFPFVERRHHAFSLPTTPVKAAAHFVTSGFALRPRAWGDAWESEFGRSQGVVSIRKTNPGWAGSLSKPSRPQLKPLPVAVSSSTTETMAAPAEAATKAVASAETATSKGSTAEVWATAEPAHRTAVEAGTRARRGWHAHALRRRKAPRSALR